LRFSKTEVGTVRIRWRVLAAVAGATGFALTLIFTASVFRISPESAGRDWLWYEDGLERLVDDRPLYDRSVTTVPYTSADPALEGVYATIPPYFVALISPFLLIPEEARQLVWILVSATAVAAAYVIAWPLQAPLLGSFVAGVGSILLLGLCFELYDANHNSLVALGVALGLVAANPILIGVGLVLAGTKAVPAIALGLWLIARRQWRALGWGIAMVAGLMLPVLLLEGPGVIVDYLRSSTLAIPADPGNFSPIHNLGLPPAAGVAAWLALTALILASRRDVLAGALCVLASLLAIPNLWSHWIPVVVVAALAVMAVDGVTDADRVGRVRFARRGAATAPRTDP
jgi:hypothetical protein